MTISRSRLVDTSVSRWYHCISRCVRRAHLLGSEAAPGRTNWIENRLRELDQIFAISIGGFSGWFQLRIAASEEPCEKGCGVAFRWVSI